jgi:regulator of protease activity HflC (stomatin/prohibitin superfamily)
MINLLFVVFFGVIAILYLLRNRTRVGEGGQIYPKWGVAIGIFILGIIIAIFQPFTIERVDAGHVGIKVNLTGDNRGVSKFEYKTGWVVYNTWISKLYEFPTYQQHIDYPEQQVITKGGFSANIKPSFNYSLKPGDVGDMFQNLRLDVRQIEQQWLQTAIVGTVNDVANKWAVDDIFNNREKFESDIVVEANKRVSKWFIISQLRTNITPPAALQQSIEAKTKAIQEVQVAENQKLVAVAEGEKRVAQARADSAALVIAAAGEAEAIRRKQVSLNQNYIDYLKVQKWDGKLPQVQSGSNGLLFQIK